MKKFIALPLILALLGAGCWPSRTPSTTTETPSRPSASGCDNPYYPLNEGHSITYKTNYGSTPGEFKLTITERDGNRFTLEYDFNVGSDSKLTQTMECSNGQINAVGYLDFGSVLSGQQISYETISNDGTFLPPDLAVGSQWESTFRVRVRTTNPQLKAMLDGQEQTFRIQNRAVAEEQVTTPAGTFTALKVESNTVASINIGGTTQSLTIPATNWFVRDVGLVKSVTSVSGGTSSSIEAIRITR